MVTIMGRDNLRYRRDQSVYWGCGTSSCSDMCQWNREHVHRQQQEEQYRQELHRRDLELYQRLQIPQYHQQSSHSLGSTWQQSSLSVQSHNPAPVVRNPSSTSDLSKQLTVDCSVEYELPDFLKSVAKDAPPLLALVIQNQRSKSCSVNVG